MRTKNVTSVALILMLLLVGQAMTGHLNQIPGMIEDSALEPATEVMASNNSGGNNSGGNNSNSNNDSHCMIVSNFSMNSNYYVTVDLVNTCSDAIQYPGVNASANHTGVSGFSNNTNWFYMIAGNDTYNLSWQLSFDQTVTNGTPITLDFEADVLHCGANNSWGHECPNSTLSHQFTFISMNTGGNNSGGNNSGGNNSGGNNSSNDSDGDGIANYYDDCPNGTSGWTSTNSTDYDSDGCEDATEDLDDDNDAIDDQSDNCINVANADQADMNDNDIGDACDEDIDGDGVTNENDDLPYDEFESVDTDADGIGNNRDHDDDGDGMADTDDAFPLNPAEQADIDGDGVGDNHDADDDADGITDVTDNCPLIANPNQEDSDNDGIGTACDSMEGDGVIINDGNSTEECLPWNNVACDDEFGCKYGERIPVLAIDEATGEVMLDSDGNQIQVWGCSENSSGENEEVSGELPSLGLIGTLVALSAGLFVAIRRGDEE